MKILLVDDDTEITQLISRQLKQNNYVVEVAFDGEHAIDLLQINPYSLILLDVVLPRLSGIEVCQTLRCQGNKIPILMLTGQDHTHDKVTGLDAGADDYLVKPFELDELIARVRALLRRNSDVPTSVLRYGDLQFNPGTQAVTYEGESISLRPKEIAILELMLRYPTQIFEPGVLLDKLWNLADCPGKATIKAHIRSLRKQLQAVGAHDVIETLYGQGYRLNPTFLDAAKAKHYEGSEALENSLSPQSTQAIVTQTWEQVQSSSWHRLIRLENLVRSRLTTPRDRWHADCQQVAKIAHQLKGTLGTFGFQTASSQAKQIEALLSVPASGEIPNGAHILAQVKTLKALVQQQLTDHQLESGQSSPALDTAANSRVLVVSRNDAWKKQLQYSGQAFSLQIEVCSPLTISACLLAQTPRVILLELAEAELSKDLSLLDILVSNYDGQVAILAIIESSQSEAQLLAIQHGSTAIALKTWSSSTLLTIAAEYTMDVSTEVEV